MCMGYIFLALGVGILVAPSCSNDVKPKTVPAEQVQCEPTEEELEEFIASPPIVEYGTVYTADHDFYQKVK